MAPSGPRGESHPGCAANHVKDRGHRFYAAHTLNIGLKIVSHLGLRGRHTPSIRRYRVVRDRRMQGFGGGAILILAKIRTESVKRK
jgi:hypothetical protein